MGSWRENWGFPISRCVVDGLSAGLEDGCIRDRGPNFMVASECDGRKD